MTVLIINQNQGIILAAHKTAKFYPSTENTCYFSCTEKTFRKIRDYIKGINLNPYAVMYW